MKKIISILTVLIVGILVLSGSGVTAVTKDYENHPPDPPTITGPERVRPGTYEWIFKANDPDGDDVSYEILWGDDTFDKWIGPHPSGEEIIYNHTYYQEGIVLIKARAKDIHDITGDWGYMSVEISKNRQMNNPIFLQFLKRFIELIL